MHKKICVIGGGNWGKNHIRTLAKLGCLGGIVDAQRHRLTELTRAYPVQGFTALEQALTHGFDGYIIATPAETHYPLGKVLLEKGQNILIEKPMALCAEHARELNDLAEQNVSRLMVGHLLLFHPAIRKIKAVLESGKIGKLHYFYSNRLNLGTVRTEENVFWSFAPHDISILDYLLGASPVAIEAKGAKFLQDEIFDVTMTQLTYPGNVHAHIYVSWLHPFKEHRIVLVGSRGMLSFEDSSVEKEILYYNKRIDLINGRPVKVEAPDEVIDYEKGLPLDEELKYFIANLDQKIEIAGGRTGLAVVKVLEQVQKLIDH